MLKSSWSMVTAAKSRSGRTCRVLRPSGWAGGYSRKPPSGYHKQLNRAEMRLLTSQWE